jgi:hypothetical protein
VTVRRLEDDVEHALISGAFDPARLPGLRGLPTRPELADPTGVQTGAEATHGETDVWVANVLADIARLFRACLYSVARSLNSGPGAALEAMLEHSIASWRLPTPRTHRVFERDGWRCTVPGCTSQRNPRAHRSSSSSRCLSAAFARETA